MKKIKEVIVVEGKDDTKRILRAVDADTIETRGSAIPDETMALIKKLAKTRGVIVFTDPDFSGEKIRKTIAAEVPNVKHAFITKKQGAPKRSEGSLGVEHASVESIKDALHRVYTEDQSAEELISREELMTDGLMGNPQSKQRRQQLGELLHIGYVNGKQLQHRLRMFGITHTQFVDAVKKIDKDGKND